MLLGNRMTVDVIPFQGGLVAESSLLCFLPSGDRELEELKEDGPGAARDFQE